MTDTLSQSHDKFFKAYFTQLEIAREFVETYLPPDVVELLELSTLKLCKDSFVDESLNEHFSDMLYQVNLTSGQPAYLYLLLDHKSYVDPFVAYQLLKYMIQIWDISLKEQRATRKTQAKGKKDEIRFPPILPLVVYHGAQSWQVSYSFEALFGSLPEPLQRYIPRFEYWLFNLPEIPRDEITGGIPLRVVLLLLKYIYSEELEVEIEKIFSLLATLRDRPTILEHMTIILRYLSGGKQADTIELNQLVDQLLEGETIMAPFIEKKINLAREQALQEGRQEGRQEGEQIGVERGRQEGEQIGLEKGEQIGVEKGQRKTHIKNIQNTISVRFGVERDPYHAPLTQVTIAQLEALSTIALTAESVAEFEAQLQGMADDR